MTNSEYERYIKWFDLLSTAGQSALLKEFGNIYKTRMERKLNENQNS